MTSLPAPQDVQAAFARVLVDEWQRAGITDAVVCPGSRSTPLLIALAEAAETRALRLHVLLDERSAGFFALGLGLAHGVPVPVVTTSGTASAELHPAVLEAHHAGVPLLAVTADRPAELHDCGAPQSINQERLYGDAVRWEASPGVPELAAAWSWRSLASRAVIEAGGAGRRAGPVHLNLAFREPLVGRADRVLAAEPGRNSEDAVQWAMGSGVAVGGDRVLRELVSGRPGRAPWHRTGGAVERTAPPEVIELLAGAGERGLIVAGAGMGDSGGAGTRRELVTDDAAAVWALSMATGWPVLASPQSGCRWPGAISSADALLRTAVVRRWQPDIVLRLGAPWSSRVVNEWLATLECPQVLVDPWGVWAAPDRSAGEVIVADPGALCSSVAAARAEGSSSPGQGPDDPWARRWSLTESAAQDAIDAALASEEGLTEPGIARSLMASAPDGSTVVASSSMPIREVEWWSRPRFGLRVLANRGVNGIDGVLSTALGVAAAGPPAGPNVIALVGDLAFLYDIGVLAPAVRDGIDLDIVLVDNDGGGIFNFLPQASSQPVERFERLWGTPHRADLGAVARAFGVAVEELSDLRQLERAVAGGAEKGKGLRVLLAKTDRVANVAVHQRLYAAVEAAILRLGDASEGRNSGTGVD
jgi:2-succinyl-5-enolpyruvyl-6-hydroxy-3-cyclohexene-1-carboxylate synthase